MPDHKLHGDWQSFTLEGNTLVPDGGGNFRLEIDTATGDLKSGSVQGAHKLKGKAKQGSHHTIKFLNEGRRREYEGTLSAEAPIGGGNTRLVICGILNLNPVIPAPERTADSVKQEGKRDAAKDRGVRTQDQIIWVATKP